jgi:glycine cleavage system aminomethyltransferase T
MSDVDEAAVVRRSASAGTDAGAGATIAFEPVMRSPLHRLHERLGATFARDGEWEYPAAYGDAAEAAGRQALDSKVAFADVSARGKADLRGAIAGLFARIARTSEGWEPGTILPIEPAPSEEHPGLIAPISDRWAILFCPPPSLATRLDELEEPTTEGPTMVTEVSSQYAGIAVAGPRTLDLLRRLTEFDVAGLEPDSCVATRALELTTIVLRRDPVIELWMSASSARYAWEALLSIGGPLGASPVGRDAVTGLGWW